MVAAPHSPPQRTPVRTSKGRRRIALTVLCSASSALSLVACGGVTEEQSPTPSVVTSTATTTVTATPEGMPDLQCHPPSVETFEVDWTREFGPGIPPPLRDNEPQPFNYFSVYRAQRAKVQLLNLSPHRIYTRGISFQVMWSTPDGTIKTNTYLYSSPVDEDRRFAKTNV